MKNCVSGGKNMTTPMRVSSKSPSETRIRKLLKKKRDKKNGKNVTGREGTSVPKAVADERHSATGEDDLG